VFRRIVSLLVVTTMLLATMVAPAFADSTRVCNNRCGDIDLSTDNSQDNDVTTNNDNDVTTNNDNDVTNNTTTKTCGNVTGNNSTCNIS
jgi:hypothetical protein